MERRSTSGSEHKPAFPSGSSAPHVPLRRLGWVFLRIGTTAFGGLGAALALVEHELVTRRQLLTKAEITEALTYTKLLPGSTVVQVMSYLGYKLGGWPGSALATAAFVLPSALLMLLLAAAYVAATILPALGPAMNGLSAAVVGMLLATTYRLGKANVTTPILGGIALAAFGAGAFFGMGATREDIGASFPVVLDNVLGLRGVVLLARGCSCISHQHL
jgi:chromate transporter